MAELVVTLRGDAPFDTIGRLERAGLKVGQHLRELNMVTGTSDPDAIARLRALDEVADVSEAQTIQLPPGDSAVQ